MESLVIAKPQPDMQVIENSLRMSAQELVAQAGEIIIMTRVDESLATDVLKAIKTRISTIEDERTKITKPINDGVKQINNRFKAIADPLLTAEGELKGKILKFKQEEEARAREEARKQQEIAEAAAKREAEIAKQNAIAAGSDALAEILPPLPPEKPAHVAPYPPESAFRPTTYGQSGAASTMKKVWSWELEGNPVNGNTDIAIRKLAEHHPELLTVDAVKLNKLVQAGLRDIPGVRIFQKDVLSVK